jgi:ribosomal protein S18 acetylase RimI-like enzyme
VPVVHLDHRDQAVAEAIVGIQRAAYAVEAETLGFDGIPPLFEFAEHVRRLDLTILGLQVGTDVVAVLGFRPVGYGVDIDRLAVDPAHFRHGHARCLLTHLHERVAPNAARFTASTGAANVPAVNLYRSLGYRVVQEVVLPEGLPVVRLERVAAARLPT